MHAGPRTPESRVVRRGRVLVVDDPLEGRRLAHVLLEHNVVPVGSGADALAVIAVGRPYDIVLCGVMLRDMSGVEFLSHLWRDHPGQAERLIFVRRGDVSPMLEYLLEGVPNLCLEAPIDLDGLRGLIERRVPRSSPLTSSVTAPPSGFRFT
jgi:CheY-like chemotaxis protein